LGKTFEEILALNEAGVDNKANLLRFRPQRDPAMPKRAVCFDADCGWGEVSYAIDDYKQCAK